jgi:uncharacterized membrane protein
MWRRDELKSLAKKNLKNTYWSAFAVSLIVGFLSSGSGIVQYRFGRVDLNMNRSWLDSSAEQWSQFFTNPFAWFFKQTNPLETFHFFDGMSRIWLLLLAIGSLIGLLGIAYQIFVAPVIQVGGNRWYSRNRESDAIPPIGMVFSLFKAGSYLKTVGSMLWMNLFLFLWGLIALVPLFAGATFFIVQIIGSSMDWPGYGLPHLFNRWTGAHWANLSILSLIILVSLLMSLPVIIKRYSYRMTPWILADNPQIGYKRALRLSMDLTSGHKWDIFILDLSFIGWYLLGLMACGVGVIFVTPYYLAVQAELYARLRRIGCDKNLCSMEELGFTPVKAPTEELL